MATLSLADATLFYEVVGDGPPLLVCHGGPGLHHAPYRSLDPLAATHALVYWDHRGHGRSSRPARATLSMPQWADDAADLAQHLGIDDAVVLGHSFGGWVAQELALRHPRLVGALVLLSTTPGQLGTGERADSGQGPPLPDEIAAIMSEQPATDEVAAAWYRALAPHFARNAAADALLAHTDGVDAASLVAVFEELSKWSSVDRLGEIRCPALVVGGREDVFCSYPQAERIAARIPDADLLVMADAGHFMWLEHADPFFATLDAWLRSHAPAA